MKSLSRLAGVAGTITVLAAICLTAVNRDSPFDIVKPFVDKQTFLIGRLDVKQMPCSDLKPRVIDFLKEVTGDARVLQDVESVVDETLQLREGFVAAGGEEIFLLVSPRDYGFVVTASDPRKRNSVEAFTSDLLGAAGDRWTIQKHGARMLIIGVASSLGLKAPKAEPCSEMLRAANAAGNAQLAVIYVPSADKDCNFLNIYRGWPSQKLWDAVSPPPALGQRVIGPTTRTGVQWGLLALEAAPALNVRLVVESKDAADARELKRAVDSSLDAVVQRALPDAATLRKLIAPSMNGKQLSFSLTEDAATLQALAKPLMAIMTDTSANGRGHRVRSELNLREIAQAMLVYHSSRKRFPPAANLDPNGRPLLSWRVHLLPFLGQQALYKQFKLDEPWDSDHNKKLVKAVIPVFVDPAGNLKRGMTTYVVPTGEGTVFGGKESLRDQDIRDGTSKTIMVVNVTPERAVIWTKPDDLAVNEATPLNGLISDNRKTFQTVFCDARVRVIDDTIDPIRLWQLFNANDGKP